MSFTLNSTHLIRIASKLIDFVVIYDRNIVGAIVFTLMWYSPNSSAITGVRVCKAALDEGEASCGFTPV